MTYFSFLCADGGYLCDTFWVSTISVMAFVFIIVTLSVYAIVKLLWLRKLSAFLAVSIAVAVLVITYPKLEELIDIDSDKELIFINLVFWPLLGIFGHLARNIPNLKKYFSSYELKVFKMLTIFSLFIVLGQFLELALTRG